MRHERDWTVADDGRDKGKVFHITEMPASRAERWAMRALLALAHSGVDVGDMEELDPASGMRGIAAARAVGGRLLKALTGLQFDEIEPLLDEMMGCVQVVPDPSKPHVRRPLMEEDVEDVTTRVRLRVEVLNVHLDFLQAGSLSSSN